MVWRQWYTDERKEHRIMDNEQQEKPSFAEKVKDKVGNEVQKIPPTTDRNLLAAVSYVWILCLVMLVVKKNDAFVQHHARQGVILFLMSLVGFIPVVGWILWVLAVAGMVVGFIKAWQGKEYQIPYVYGWSQKIHF